MEKQTSMGQAKPGSCQPLGRTALCGWGTASHWGLCTLRGGGLPAVGLCHSADSTPCRTCCRSSGKMLHADVSRKLPAAGSPSPVPPSLQVASPEMQGLASHWEARSVPLG